MKQGVYLILAIATIAIAPPDVSNAQSFQGLGIPSGSDRSVAVGVNGDGSVAVGYAQLSSGANVRAFRWTDATGMVDLGHLPLDAGAAATGVSADGSVVVGESGSQSFLWTAATGMTAIGSPGFIAHAISGDGSVVVGEKGSQAFRWTAASGMLALGALPAGNITVPHAVNTDGTVIVGKSQGSTASSNQAFRWTAATGMQGIGGSEATAVSADGSVIVGNTIGANGPLASRWTAATGFVPIGALPGAGTSFATAVNADGSVVVGYSGEQPFRWTAATGMQSISALLTASGVNIDGWQLQLAFGVSADGSVVVGVGRDPSGRQQAWVARLSMPPQSSIVAAVAPNARTTTIGSAVTAFATIINSGPNEATSCSIGLPNGVPALFSYQTTDPATNTPVGTPNTRINIPAGKAQSFYFALTPVQTTSQDIALGFGCANTKPAPIVWGLNTFLLTANVNPSTDMVSISDTLSHDGNIAIQGSTGTGLMVVASINIGEGGSVTFTPSDTPFGQAPRFLPLAITICQTDRSGKCINPTTPGNSSTVAVAKGQTLFFSIFVQGVGTTIPYDPGNSRVFVLATQAGVPVGEASAAVKMQ
jgi:probable HAF family extracellular repeat protein